MLDPHNFCCLLCPSLHKIFPWCLHFPEEISSLSHSIVSLYICVVTLRRPSYLSLLVPGSLYSVGYIFPFPPCFLLLFFPQLFVKPRQTTTLPSCIYFFFGMVLITNSCTVLGTNIWRVKENKAKSLMW